MTSNGLDGTLQGNEGKLQGPIGAMAAKTGGANEGIARAATGGMAGQTPADKQRKSMGLFSFLQPIASIAAAVPGPWQPFAAGASALMGGIAQNNQNRAAGAAANAAQQAQGNALSGASDIAGNLTGPADYSGILNAERSGGETFKRNAGGVANPGALLKDLGGQNIENAIGGALENWTGQQEAAAGILQRNAGQYNGIGQQAGAAAQAGGNPFSQFFQALNGTNFSRQPGTPASPAAPQFGTDTVNSNVSAVASTPLSPGLPGYQTGFKGFNFGLPTTSGTPGVNFGQGSFAPNPGLSNTNI